MSQSKHIVWCVMALWPLLSNATTGISISEGVGLFSQFEKVFPNPAVGETSLIPNATTASKELNVYGNRAFAEGSLSSGALRVLTVTDYIRDSSGNAQYDIHGFAYASVAMSDRLTLSNVLPGQQGFLTVKLTGSFTKDPDNNQGSGNYGTAYVNYGVSVYKANVPGVVAGKYFQFQPSNKPVFDPTCPAGATCEFTDTPIVYEHLPDFSLANGDFIFGMNLTATTSSGYAADFSRTARVYLNLPSNVSFTSESGVFLKDAQSLSPVPLPAAVWLFGPALAGLSSRRRCCVDKAA